MDIYVSIVEDDDKTRENLDVLIDGTSGYSCISTYSDCESALEKIGDDDLIPDVVLLDIGLGDEKMSGIEGVEKLKEKFPDMEVIMMTIYQDNKSVFDSLRNGASGYLSKDTLEPLDILNAIKEINDGGAPMSTKIARMVLDSFKKDPDPYSLSRREKEVLQKMSDGNNRKAIAKQLFISEHTVKYHIRNIYRKLEVNNRSSAVRKAIKEDLV